MPNPKDKDGSQQPKPSFIVTSSRKPPVPVELDRAARSVSGWGSPAATARRRNRPDPVDRRRERARPARPSVHRRSARRAPWIASDRAAAAQAPPAPQSE